MGETYKSAAGKGFDFLWRYYNATNFDGNFWFAGNTFHTCLDYLINAGVPDTNATVVTTGYLMSLKGGPPYTLCDAYTF